MKGGLVVFKSVIMITMRKKVSTMLVIALLMVVPVAVSAQTTDVVSIVASLKEQIKQLQVQIAALMQQTQELKAEIILTRNLARGERGDDVSALQEMLARDKQIYPEGQVTGFFGPLTEKAIRRFQEKHGIEALGLVGPKTRAKFHELFGDNATSTFAKKKQEQERDKVVKHDDDTDSDEGDDADGDDGDDDNDDNRGDNHDNRGKGNGKIVVCHKGQTLNVGAPAAFGHLIHGDSFGACHGNTDGDDDDDTSTTTPDTIAPIISSLTATNVASTSATVSWLTNEIAGSVVWYDSANALVIASTTPSITNTTLITNHVLGLTGLTASTTYQALVVSADAAGNTATSSVLSFTTSQ